MNGMFFGQKRGKRRRSEVWKKFDEIYSADSKQQIKYFYQCCECREIIYSPYNDGNTNRLLRHICYEIDANNNSETAKTLLITKSDRENLKMASAKFVSKDLRPYYAVECKGLLDLCYSCVKFGQKYRKASEADFLAAMPSRNTVRSAVTEMANVNRKKIAHLIKSGINSGGVAASTDTWTDDYRHATYINVVAHLCIHENNEIKYYRFILSTSEITEIVKKGTQHT